MASLYAQASEAAAAAESSERASKQQGGSRSASRARQMAAGSEACGGTSASVVFSAATALFLLQREINKLSHVGRQKLPETLNNDEPKTPEDFSKILPSIPLSAWTFDSQKAFTRVPDSEPQRCGSFPTFYNISLVNGYWQVLKTPRATFQLFNAYYDARNNSTTGPSIRIVAMGDKINPQVSVFCQLWFEEQQLMTVVRVAESKYMWSPAWSSYKNHNTQPYLITCPVPQDLASLVPSSVSLVERRCKNATNNLRVFHNVPPGNAPKDGIAVCVKGLDFPYVDLSPRLIEWIELVRLLGASKIFFYDLQVHANTARVLRHYERQNFVETVRLTLPGGQPSHPALQHLFARQKLNQKRKNELVPYNDCFYRNIHRFRHVALLDIDEVIVPLRDSTWSELLRRVVAKEGRWPSYSVQNVYFIDDMTPPEAMRSDVPAYLHMLRHTFRSANFTKPHSFVKTFFDTERVLVVHNHYALAFLGEARRGFDVPREDAQLQHYRGNCVADLKRNCDEFKRNKVEDASLMRFREQLVERCEQAMSCLGLLG